ncbi:MAG: hypothetical protein V1835_03895 [Candidatus Micrarchaeota archaeon]
MNKLLVILGMLIISLQAVGAADIQGHVKVVQPVSGTFYEGGVVDLGVVGPGQRIEIEIARSSNIYNFKNEEEVWDKLYIDVQSLPRNWIWDDSLRYEANPKALVIVDKDTPDGEYEFGLYTERDYNTAAKYPVHFKAKVAVTKDVLMLSVKTKSVKGGVNQPSEFVVYLENKGSANDAFDLELASGLPGKWAFKKQVFIPHNSPKILQYEVVASDPGTFSNMKFRATSLSSETIFAEDDAELIAASDLVTDMKSVGNGVILFPYVEQPIYYLLGFIANNFFS